jgi:hypothetical protein
VIINGPHAVIGHLKKMTVLFCIFTAAKKVSFLHNFCIISISMGSCHKTQHYDIKE